MKPIRVLIAEPMEIVRSGIRAVLSPIEDAEIVGETRTADETLEWIRGSLPDVVLMDENLPGGSFPAIRAIKQAVPSIEIIVMTERLDDAKALQAVEMGATGYILKDIPAVNLAGAIRAVRIGRAFFHPEMTRKLAERLGRLSREDRARVKEGHEGLTAREIDILHFLARGMTDGEIAQDLFIAEGTVKTHIRHLLRKLGARNRTEAVAYALRKRLIQ